MKKRVLSLFLVLLLAFGGFGGVLARGSDTAKNPDFGGDCGDALYWEFSMDTGVLRIYGTGAMYDYDTDEGSRSPWAEYEASITSVVIDEGVTRIGTRAFHRCASIVTISIPASVTSMGSSPFFGCASLEAITVDQNNNNFRSVDGILFNKAMNRLMLYPMNKAGTSYAVPAGVTIIDGFFGNRNLVSVSLPPSIYALSVYAFRSCESLETVVISGKITSFGMMAFDNCPNLSTAVFLNDVPTSTGTNIFRNAAEDFCIYYTGEYASSWSPNGETTWNDYPIQQIPGGKCGDDLYWVYIDSAKELRIYGTGDMYDYTTGTVNAAPWAEYCGSIISVVAEEGATGIGDNAFKSIYDYSISLPSTMTSFTVYSTVNSLPNRIDVAEGNPYLRSVDGVLYNKDMTALILYPSALYNKVYTVPDGVTVIGEGAFLNCLTVDAVVLPVSVDTLEDYAFTYAIAVSSLIFKGAPPANVGEDVFYEAGSSDVGAELTVFYNWNYRTKWSPNGEWHWNGVEMADYSENMFFHTWYIEPGEEMLLGFRTDEDTYLAVNYNPNASNHYYVSSGGNYYGYTTRALMIGSAVGEAMGTVTQLRYCTWVFDNEWGGHISSGYETGRWLKIYSSTAYEDLYPGTTEVSWNYNLNNQLFAYTNDTVARYAQYFNDGTNDLMKVTSEKPTDQKFVLYRRIYVDMPLFHGVPGDMDGDGFVTMADVTLLSMYLNGEGTGISEEGMLNADANFDGIVDIRDIAAIYEIIANS